MPKLRSQKGHLCFEYENRRLYISSAAPKGSPIEKEGSAAIAKLIEFLKKEGVPHEIYKYKLSDDRSKQVPDTILLSLFG